MSFGYVLFTFLLDDFFEDPELSASLLDILGFFAALDLMADVDFLLASDMM